jgi:ketosteroid isomerase-like protein
MIRRMSSGAASRTLRAAGLLLTGSLAIASARGQQMPPASPTLPKPAVPAPQQGATPFKIVPFKTPELSPGVLQLLQLEGDFAESVKVGGGKAFVTWFADDAVILNNGQPVILGRGALAEQANWDPRTYQLNWVADGAQMGPSGDMGFTWGQYEGRTIPPDGKPIITRGRFITIWKKLPDGTWKVAMDASANSPAAAGLGLPPPPPPPQ